MTLKHKYRYIVIISFALLIGTNVWNLPGYYAEGNPIIFAMIPAVIILSFGLFYYIMDIFKPLKISFKPMGVKFEYLIKTKMISYDDLQFRRLKNTMYKGIRIKGDGEKVDLLESYYDEEDIIEVVEKINAEQLAYKLRKAVINDHNLV